MPRPFLALIRRQSSLLVAGAALLVMVGALVVAYAEHTQYRERVRAQTVSDVSNVRAALESALANRLVLPDALAALSIAHRGDVASEFDHFARGLAESHRSYLGATGDDAAVRSLQLAPDAVVTFVFPLEGNEAALGHDLLADPVRGPAVRRAIDERRFVLAGPFELVQGGTGLVGRTPIYLDDDSFWGFATVVLNFEEVAREAGLASSERNGFTYTLRGRDGLGAEGEVFWGDVRVFDRNPVLLDVLVPNGTWQVGALPTDGWPLFPLRPVSLVILAVGAALATLVVVVLVRWERERQAVTRMSDNLTRLVDSTTSPIVAVDAAGWITEWNRAMVELTGLSREVATAARFEDLCGVVCTPDVESSRTRRAVEAVAAGELETGEATVTIGSPPRTVAFIVTARMGPDGSRGAVLVGHDITARLEAERMRTENVALARTARLKDEFLAGMSHELRTPLNAIIGLSSVLGRRTFGELSDKQSEYVDQISASGQHLLGLINDVLDLAKLDADRVELELGPCDLTSVIGETLDLIRPLAARRGVSVDLAPVGNESVVVGDRRRLLQILVNLASNAVKFTERGGRMGVELEGRAEQIAVTVWDTGIGIDLESQHLLFEPFLQVDGSLSRQQEGSGLGLAIASKLVGLHGGSISVDSLPGRGSRFTMVLPVGGPDHSAATAQLTGAVAGGLPS